MYKIVKKVITNELASFCYDYLHTKRKAVELFFTSEYISCDDHTWGRFDDPQALDTYYTYGDMVMETLLAKLHPRMEVETELKLYPTYSYARLYKKGDILERHKDRYSCEVSTTLNLGGDPWPLFLEPSGEEDKQGISILLEPGDMLIYDGCKFEHWREEFEGENCGQVFLHYNNALLDTAAENKYDGRPFLGLPPYFIGTNKDGTAP